LALLGLLTFVVGCGQSSTPDSVGSGGSAALTPEDDAAIPEEQVGRGSAEVINDPAQAKPGGSYRLEPKDPNDPKFQADPRLAGGG
jgi:hypothetical protein